MQEDVALVAIEVEVTTLPAFARKMADTES
jgi:hypothetical protein